VSETLFLIPTIFQLVVCSFVWQSHDRVVSEFSSLHSYHIDACSPHGKCAKHYTEHTLFPHTTLDPNFLSVSSMKVCLAQPRQASECFPFTNMCLAATAAVTRHAHCVSIIHLHYHQPFLAWLCARCCTHRNLVRWSCQATWSHHIQALAFVCGNSMDLLGFTLPNWALHLMTPESISTMCRQSSASRIILMSQVRGHKRRTSTRRFAGAFAVNAPHSSQWMQIRITESGPTPQVKNSLRSMRSRRRGHTCAGRFADSAAGDTDAILWCQVTFALGGCSRFYT
jgi:hypothetical protein